MRKIILTLTVFVVVLNSFSQNVGIGTNTPASKLSIEGSDNSTQSKNAVIQLTNTGTGSNNSWYLRSGATGTFTPAGGFSIGDKTANRLILDSNGNVGIGINPAFSLDVLRGTSISGTARFSGTTYPTQFNYGATENTYISGGLSTSHIMMNFFGGGNVGVGQGIIPSSTFEVARGTGSATAYFHGSSFHSIFNSGVNEETYIRGGKSGADVYINDLNGGKLRVGGNSTPTATLDVSRGTGQSGTAMFRGTTYLSHFNYDTTENTYIRGGKAGSDVFISDITGGHVVIGNTSPFATLTVMKNPSHNATALFYGTNFGSYFNYLSNENTYLEGGKSGADVYLSYNNGGKVKVGSLIAPTANLDIERGSGADGTAIIRGTNYHSLFNSGSEEDTYIRSGKTGSDVYINDNNRGRVTVGSYRQGQFPLYQATFNVYKDTIHSATAGFWGSHTVSTFNYGSNEDTYIQGGKVGSNLFLCDYSNGNVRIGTAYAPPSSRLDVEKGAGNTSTALFRGTNYNSAFNSGSTEDTYIQGGKAGANVTINDQAGGKVGIGATPTFADGVLDVNGRMRIRSGGDIGHTAGIWLNKTDNSALHSFIGVADDSHAGIYSLALGVFPLLVNTDNGALKINGDEGNAGQVLTSQGSGQPATWKSAGTTSLYNNANSYSQAGTLRINCVNCFGDLVPSTAAPLVITGTSKILISYSGHSVSTNGILGDTRVQITLSIIDSQGNPVVNDSYFLRSPETDGISFSKTTNLIVLPPGTYAMKLSATIHDNRITDLSNGIITAIVIQQ